MELKSSEAYLSFECYLSIKNKRDRGNKASKICTHKKVTGENEAVELK